MSVENCVWKNKVKKIFLLNLCGSKTSKEINTTTLVQIIFKAGFGYFEYISYLPHGIH